MPGEGGLSLCRFLVESSGSPVILLTAMAEDTERVVGLKIGADDYVTKPFNPRELLARIRAVLPRTSLVPKERDPITSDRLTFDGWTLDLARQHMIGRDGVITPLSTGEFQLLVAFLKRPKTVLSRDQLLDLTSGRTPTMFDRSIDNQVSRLRRKIEANAKQPVLIKTVLGRWLQVYRRRRGPRRMSWRNLRFLPRSLAGQLIALILAALIVSQLFTLWLFTDERRAALLELAGGTVVSGTAARVELLDETPQQLHEQIRSAASSPLLHYRISARPALPDSGTGPVDRRIRQNLQRELGEDRAIRSEVGRNIEVPRYHRSGHRDAPKRLRKPGNCESATCR